MSGSLLRKYMTSSGKPGLNTHLPNAISLSRGVIACFLPGLLFSPSPKAHLLALFLFILGSISDYFDGWLARRMGGESGLGKILDPTMDKVLILIPMMAFVKLGFYSAWWVVPIFLREFVVTFCRIGLLREGKAIGAEMAGKLKLVMQVVALLFPFLLLMANDYASLRSFTSLFHAGTAVLFIITIVLTLYSGASFFRNNSQLFLSTDFAKYVSAAGVGLIPITPGTLGSLFALAFIPFVAWNAWLYAAIFILCFAAAYWAVNRLDLSVVKDPQFVVMDEVLGMMVTLWGIPLNLTTVLLGFFLFRLFDILKPPPCRQFEKLPGFWGITCDDLMAGAYGWLILFIFFR